MENQLELDFENMRLHDIQSIIQKHLSSARLNSQEKEADIITAKREMYEETKHSLSNLYSNQGFHELAALSQYTNPLSDKISQHDTLANKINSLEIMLKSPYFARIDFKYDDEEEFEAIYIGRSSLSNDKSYEMLIYDWRSPIASVFYRFGIGKAFYQAPAGKITGEVGLKRQYEINNGILEYFFDSDVQIVDEFLRKLLSENTSPSMKTIVETIQRDQDIVIRDMENDLLMVQGAAGSGKTSIGLHRAAYLMYKGLTSKLSSHNIIVISPNTLFERYIANVLPELGEKNVETAIFEDMCGTILGYRRIQSKNNFLESLISCHDKKNREVMKRSIEFKSNRQFAEILIRFVQDLPRRWIEFSDVYYDGRLVTNRQLLKTKLLCKNRRAPLGLRLQQLEGSVLERVHELRKGRIKKLQDFTAKYSDHTFDGEEFARLLSIEESTALIKEIQKFTRLNILDLYKRLFSDKKYFYRLSKGIELPDCIDDIINLTQARFKEDFLPYDDVSALTFLFLKIYGCNAYKTIKQVVIDEAQDYYPLHFEVFSILFPRARYTVLGDINQTIEKQEGLSLYEQISRILGKEKSTLVTMDKSFRCTKEILTYSAKFISQASEVKSFSRSGDEPVVHKAGNSSELDDMLIREALYCREKGYQSIGLICKTEGEAVQLFERLKDKLALSLIKGDGTGSLSGTFIIPVYMSKGLEFDAVLICGADKEHYHTEDDKKLLYIECTRALHRLSLFYTGEVSPLL